MKVNNTICLIGGSSQGADAHHSFPASLNGIQFDAIISRETTYEADVPDYPIEDGFYSSDSVLKRPVALNVTAFISNTPVTWKRLASSDRLAKTIKALEDLYFAGNLVTFTTPKRTYSSMAITSINIPETNEMANAVEVKFTLKQVRVAKSKTTTIPRSYGLSGATAENGGTSSTTTETDEGTVKKSSSLLFGLFGGMFEKK